MAFFSAADGRLLNDREESSPSLSVGELPALYRGGNSLGRTYDMLYPLTSIWPVYLPSIGARLSPRVEDDPLGFEERPEEEMEVEIWGGDRPNTEWYDSEDLAGRFKARAALCNSGDIVEEKL
jgi:hypothetical protein